MGTFGPGPFDNDDALDFVGECLDQPALHLREALQAVEEDYVDASVGGPAWAAAEVVALSFGRGSLRDLPDLVAELVLRSRPTRASRALALRAVERLGGEGSELAELWAETQDADAFRARLEDLRARLVDAAAGAIPIPKPKKGEIFLLKHEGFELALQALSAHEVVVFEGAATEADDVEALACRPGHRVAIRPSVVLDARVVGSAPIARAFRGTKRYVRVDDDILRTYGVGPVGPRELDWVGYEEVRDLDVLVPHDRTGLATIARGGWQSPKPPTPEQRLASRRERMAERWAREREHLTPHPLASPLALRTLLKAGEAHPDALVMGWTQRALGREPPFATLEDARKSPWPTHWQDDRDTSTFAALVALWTESYGRDVWPSDLAIPDPPQAVLLPQAVHSARVGLQTLHSDECELRLVWEAGPDGGAAFRHHLDSLEAALQRAAEKHPWNGSVVKVWFPRNLGFPLRGPEFEADLDAVIASLDS